MIDRLEGIVQAIEEQKIIIRAGPISFGVYVANERSIAIGSTVSLHIYMVWNQENGPSLYGFDSALDKTIFMMVIGCNGIGPKLGLSILSRLGSAGFLEAIQSANHEALSSVSGIGTKKAEQIMVSCKHKVQKLIISGITLDNNLKLSCWYEIDQALTSLRYSRSEINNALEYLRSESTSKGTPTFDYLLRKALSYLSQRQ
ncbi:MAG TPA: Holliday junction branch migration protein RuvA [Candidatus Babeliales bacterium]|jgi:Holliday junction DNA helicase RuvA|nr:Holliday junction branch migration protein RuvA [Candidatus Babeliales bacterium]